MNLNQQLQTCTLQEHFNSVKLPLTKTISFQHGEMEVTMEVVYEYEVPS